MCVCSSLSRTTGDRTPVGKNRHISHEVRVFVLVGWRLSTLHFAKILMTVGSDRSTMTLGVHVYTMASPFSKNCTDFWGTYIWCSTLNPEDATWTMLGWETDCWGACFSWSTRVIRRLFKENSPIISLAARVRWRTLVWHCVTILWCRFMHSQAWVLHRALSFKTHQRRAL